jgi:hypothetical protein
MLRKQKIATIQYFAGLELSFAIRGLGSKNAEVKITRIS